MSDLGSCCWHSGNSSVPYEDCTPWTCWEIQAIPNKYLLDQHNNSWQFGGKYSPPTCVLIAYWFWSMFSTGCDITYVILLDPINSLREQIVLFIFYRGGNCFSDNLSHWPRLLLDLGIFYHQGLPASLKGLNFSKTTWLRRIQVRVEVVGYGCSVLSRHNQQQVLLLCVGGLENQREAVSGVSYMAA